MIDEEATFKRFGYYSYDLKPKSHKKVVATCDRCGKMRIISKKDYHAFCLPCSRKSKNNHNWQGGKVKRICEECGKVRYFYLSAIKHGEGKFCSPKCKGKWMSKQCIGKNSANWRGGKIMRTCKECGVEFPVEPSQIKKGNAKFCSRQCFYKWLAKHIRGEKNVNWKNGVSFEPYCEKFNYPFKEYIREKFGRICFLCSKTEEENGRKLDVHHVNYNKACGCDGDETCQFVPLCISCNSKVNHNRKMWEKKIKDMMKNKLSGWFI